MFPPEAVAYFCKVNSQSCAVGKDIKSYALSQSVKLLIPENQQFCSPLYISQGKLLAISLADFENGLNPSRLTKIESTLLTEKSIELWLKRDDQLHPVVSGNKWRKLKYNLCKAISDRKDTLVSMGGAYSNHLHALAYVGNRLGLKTAGIVRGEPPAVENATITDLKRWGMDLHFVSRDEYRWYRENAANPMPLPYQSNHYWLPEGGANDLALQGVGEIVAEIAMSYDYLCAPCGTGTTLAGLIKHTSDGVHVLGFSALKNVDICRKEVQQRLTKQYSNWQLIEHYHFGGFAKINQDLTAFIQGFETATAIQLEPVYTGKMLYGIFDLASLNYFPPGSRIIAIHTGGLQGNRGFT